jgi:hypothetical protein
MTAFVLHIVLIGRLPPETQTGSLVPSIRQPAPQQYWSLPHVSCIGSQGPPFGLQTPPGIPMGAFTQILPIGQGMLGGSQGVSGGGPEPPAPPEPVVGLIEPPAPGPVSRPVVVELSLPPAPGPLDEDPVVSRLRDVWSDEQAKKRPVADEPTTSTCRICRK